MANSADNTVIEARTEPIRKVFGPVWQIALSHKSLYPSGSLVIWGVSFSPRGCEAYSLVLPTFLRAWLSPGRVADVSELKRSYEKWSACIQGESNGRLPETASYASPDDERDTMITFLPSEPQRR